MNAKMVANIGVELFHEPDLYSMLGKAKESMCHIFKATKIRFFIFASDCIERIDIENEKSLRIDKACGLILKAYSGNKKKIANPSEHPDYNSKA